MSSITTTNHIKLPLSSVFLQVIAFDSFVGESKTIESKLASSKIYERGRSKMRREG